MAIVLATFASIGWAQEPLPLPPGQRELPIADYVSYPDISPSTGGALPAHRSQSGTRPVYAEMTAVLANFDRDADPDGWRATVVLRDRHDQAVVMRSRARFELWPRQGLADGVAFEDTGDAPLRWHVELRFDQQGVARVKLPLRSAIGGSRAGWTSRADRRSHTAGSRSNGHHRQRDRTGWRSRGSQSRTRITQRGFQTRELHTALLRPTVGEMRVRVSVPTEGVFAAAWPVDIQPSFLVDTSWPYR